MSDRLIGVLALLVATSSAATPASAQGFTNGTLDIGPTIGVGGIGSASLAFGGRLEKAIRGQPDMRTGVLGIEASFDYYSWHVTSYDYAYVSLGGTVNYHFALKEAPSLDPFLGLGLGYSMRNCEYSGSGIDACPDSALYLIGRAGFRYYIQPDLALYVDLGAGATALNLGLMFRIH